MGKKLGLDKSYNALKTVLGSYPITGGKFPKGSFMERRLQIGAGSGGKKYPSALTTSVNKGSKLLNVGKKVFGRTPIGRAVNAAVNIGAGIGVGYGIAKEKFNKKDVDKKNKSSSNESYEEGRKEGSKKFKQLKEKVSNTAGQVTGFLTGKRYGGAMKKMAGGMMQGYGAARTSGMGLEDQSLMPGKMTKAALGILAMKKAKDKGAKGLELLSPVAMATKFFSKGGKIIKAKEGKMLSAKQKKIARMAPPPDKITGADFKAMKAKYGKMMKK
jgi:hypothetical protein